jgi:hypothetical protein
MDRCRQFFIALQQSGRDWLYLGTTKTGLGAICRLLRPVRRRKLAWDRWPRESIRLVHRRKRHREEALRAIKRTFADLLKRRPARVARSDIINVLDKLVGSDKAVTAARSLAYARAAFN